MVGVRHIAGGEDAGDTGLQMLIDYDPVMDLDTRPRGQLGAGNDSHPNHDEVAIHGVPIVEPCHRSSPVPDNGFHLHSEVKFDAIRSVKVAPDFPDHGAERPFHRRGVRVHQRYFEAHLPE